MKKIWMIFCFSLLFCSTVFFGCENKENQNEEIVLRIANWEEYLDEAAGTKMRQLIWMRKRKF